MKYHLGEIVKFGSKEFIVNKSVDGFLTFNEYKEKKERKMRLLNSKRSKYRLTALLLIVLVLTPLLMLTGCSDGCDNGGCIDIPPVVETVTETVEVPVEVPVIEYVEVPVIQYVDREVIVEVDRVLMKVCNLELSNNPHIPKRVTLKVKNISNVTLYKFKLTLSESSILHGYGSSTTYKGNGVFELGSSIQPGATLNLTLDLNSVPSSALEVSVEVL